MSIALAQKPRAILAIAAGRGRMADRAGPKTQNAKCYVLILTFKFENVLWIFHRFSTLVQRWAFLLFAPLLMLGRLHCGFM